MTKLCFKWNFLVVLINQRTIAMQCTSINKTAIKTDENIIYQIVKTAIASRDFQNVA